MRLKLVRSLDQLTEIKDDWNRLSGDLPMRTWEWNYTWAETMLGPNELVILLGMDANDRPIGIAPLYLKHDWLRGEVLRFLGDESCCTDYTTFLCEPNSMESFVDAVTEWLMQKSAGSSLSDVESLTTETNQWLGWDVMVLQGIDKSDAAMQRFSRAMAEADCTVKTTGDDACWQLDLPDSWAEYVESLSRSQRRNVRLVERRALNASDVTIKEVSEPGQLAKAMRWFRDLHQRRWEQQGQPGCFADEAFANFLTKIAERMFACGRLRMLWIEKAGVPIAVDFSFLSQDASFGYQMGIDPDYRDQEIGRAMLVAAMQATHQSGRRRFDFLRGSESYKKRWNATACPLVTLEVVADRTLPQLRNSLFDLGRNAKRQLKAWRF